MKKALQLLLLFTLIACLSSCNSEDKQLADNINMYSNTWDEIINNGKLELFDNTRFDEDITLIMSPENVVGITNVQEFYANYLTGFSNIEFTIVDVFGQGDKIMKHWNFKGTHSGDFFGIPATGKMVDIDGVTLVKMKNGKITQEQDFMDNMAFMQQLGILSSPDNVSIIDGMYKSFATGDVPAVLAAFDANIIWNEAENFPYADRNPYKGPDAVVDGVFARLGSEWDYWNLVDIELHDMANDQVLATGRYQAKYKKNGKTIDAQFAHLWTLKEGKVLNFQQYADTKQVTDVVGK
ncbi:MAG: ester cyclase [Maribacter sp.]|nr:ester cyclase [Maribacter sp.]MBT8313395.1 ester cyclase [Maribacter sp.]NNK19387.1 SnoaL-like domain-containing protein [Maribacter sp.]